MSLLTDKRRSRTLTHSVIEYAVESEPYPISLNMSEMVDRALGKLSAAIFRAA